MSKTLFLLCVVALTAAKSLKLSILHVNDHHSHLDSASFILSNTTYGDVAIDYGGFPRMVTLIKKLKRDAEKMNRGVLKLHAGDALTGTLYYSLYNGAADAKMMSYICFDAFELGNHEFDDGDSRLADFIDMMHKYKRRCPKTPVLGANVIPGKDSPLQNKIQPYTIKRIQKERVGIIGINISGKTMFSSNPDDGTFLVNEFAAATLAARKLTEEEKVDKIILLTHVGIGNDLEILAQVPGVDIIIGGDSHTLLGNYTGLNLPFNPAYPYPKMVGNVCVAHAWEYAHGVGNLQVTFDKEGVVESCKGKMAFPFDGSAVYEGLDIHQSKLISTELENSGFFVDVNQHKSAAKSLEMFRAEVDELKETIVAEVPEGICLERFPGEGRSQICTPEETKDQGGGVFNLVAKSFLTLTKTADFAIQNAGGCRSDIFPGGFSINDAFNVLPFQNTLVTLELTGGQVIDMLNEALNFALTMSSGAYPYGNGIRYDVDAKKGEVSNIEVNIRMEEEWMPIDVSASYTLVTNDYIANGKDGYFLFAEVPSEKRIETFSLYSQSLIDFAREKKVLEDIPKSEYSTKSYIPGSNLRASATIGGLRMGF